MRLMAVGTGDAGAIHPALHERSVFVDLTIDLAVRMIQPGFKQGGKIGVQKSGAGLRIFRDLFATGVASGAGLDFHRNELFGSMGDSGLRIDFPPPLVFRLQPGRQSHVVRAGQRRLPGLRPGNMTGTGSMTGLAGHVHVGPRRGIGVAVQIIVLLQVR